MKIVALLVEDDSGNVQVAVYPNGSITKHGSLKVNSKLYLELQEPEFRNKVKEICNANPSYLGYGDF